MELRKAHIAPTKSAYCANYATIHSPYLNPPILPPPPPQPPIIGSFWINFNQCSFIGEMFLHKVCIVFGVVAYGAHDSDVRAPQ